MLIPERFLINASTQFADGYRDTTYVTIHAGQVQGIPSIHQRSYLTTYISVVLVAQHYLVVDAAY